jgi:hypothetical protein
LIFTSAAETPFPTTPIRNIIFKLVKWGHISDLTWQCIPWYCCLIPERVFTVLCCSRSGNISCI